MLLVIFGIASICTWSGITDAGQVNNSLKQNSKPLAIERIQITDELREKVAVEALKTIHEAGKMVVAAGGDQSATILCEEGFKIGFELLASCRKTLNDAFIAAHTLVSKDPEAAIEKINDAVQRISNYIFVASVPVHTVPGAALAKVGELARPGLRTALKLIHHCGVVLFETLKNAQRVASSGIKVGGDASDLSLMAAHEVFNTGEEAIYKLLIDSAESSFEGLKAAAGKTPVREFPERTDALITNEVPEAQFAIDELTAAFNTLLKIVTEKRQIEAIKAIYHGFLSSIFDIANTIVMSYRVIDGAETLLGQNPEVAVNALHKRMIDVDNAILSVSADAILGLGAAGEICNKKVVEELKSSIISVVEGRVHLLMDIISAEKVAILGLRAGGEAARQGFKAARASVAAASNTLFSHFIDAARKAFNALHKRRN